MTANPLHILHVLGGLDPESGGPPMIAARLAAAQANLGHHVAIAVQSNPANPEAAERALADIPAFDRVALISPHAPPHNTPHDAPHDAGKSRHLRAQGFRAHITPHVIAADFVHLHSVWERALPITAKAARKHKTPYAILLNGMLDPWSLAQSKWKKKIALLLAYRAMLNNAAFLHLGNADERNLIAPLRLAADTRIIPNGVNLEEFPETNPGAFRAKYPALANTDRPYILFLSRLHYKKGLDLLAIAFAKIAHEFPDTDLVVAGPDGGAQAEFEHAIANANLTARTHVIGPVYGPDKYAAITDAACFCLPSRQEGFSVAILEALGCATPVVITENCHFPEVATENAGHVTKLDPAAVADGLRAVLQDPARAKATGQAGRALIEQRYTWSKIAQQSVDAYKDAIASL